MKNYTFIASNCSRLIKFIVLNHVSRHPGGFSTFIPLPVMKIGIVSFAFILVACTAAKQNPVLNDPPFTTPDTLIHTKIETEEVFGSAVCMFLIDSVLFIADHFNRDTAVWGFHTGKNKITKAYARKGRGPGEISSSPSSNIQYDSPKGCFTLYDPNYKKIIEYHVRDTHFYECHLPFRDAILRNNFVQEVIKTDSFQIYMGTGGSFSTGKRFLIYDNANHFVKETGNYPTIDIPCGELAEICQYGEEIRVKPDKSKFVIASYIGGILEIFDLQHLPDSIPRVMEKIYYRPIYEKDVSGTINTSEKNIYGFENIYVTDNAIYALLFDHHNPELIFPNKIIVYDWNGKWITGYALDCMLHSLCIDERNNLIYGMAFSENESFHLVYFKLKNT